MPQKKGTSSNKKKNKASRNTASSTCVQCAKPVPKAYRIECICTSVIYCSLECQEKSLSGQGRHQCSGPPEQVTKLEPGDAFNTLSDEEEWKQEHERTILKPCLEYRLQTAGGRAMTATPPMVESYARAADQGHAPSAYQAGVHYKNRWMGEIKRNSRGDFESNNADAAEELGVLQTDRLAFKYLSQASEAGIGIAMMSLADCYENGQGCEVDLRMGSSWLWRAVLLNSATAYGRLDCRNLIVVEHRTQYQTMDKMRHYHYLKHGQDARMGGPNLGALILALSDSLIQNNYMLPAFAGSVPTGTVGNRPAKGTTGPVRILGAQFMKEIEDCRAFFRMQDSEFCYIYGRRGTSKAATSLLGGGEISRYLDSPMYMVPLPPACDGTPTNEEVCQWKKLARLPRQLMVQCVHVEASGEQEPSWSVCDKCIEVALERMWAVSHGAVVLSLDEAIDGKGHTAIFRRRDGKIASENFKYYARGDVECTLAALVAARDDFKGLHCHPLFVAQDPNLFWPLIYWHGSIRAALEFVAPHVEWDNLIGSVRQCPEALPLAKSGTILSSGDRMRKCGSDLCLNLDVIPNTFFSCGLCNRREYCSNECAKNDWRLHRLECKPASKGSKREVMPKDPVQTRENRAGTEPTVGEHVLLHGLQARPEFNGNLGEVTGERVKDRYPIKVSRQDTPLLIKLGNLHRLGIDIVKKSSEPMQFKCLMHGSTVCSECCFDFTIANHLAKLMGEPISHEAIATIAETHFGAIESDLGSGETGSRETWSFEFENDLPMECRGLKKKDRCFVLQSLLAQKADDRLEVSAAIVGLACYSGRNFYVARSYAVPHLEALVDKHITEHIE